MANSDLIDKEYLMAVVEHLCRFIKTEIDNIEVDEVLNAFSKNPIANKAVYDALLEKVDKIEGKGLSTNDYTTADKEKLDNIENNAEVNVRSDWNEDDDTNDAYILNKPDIPTKTSDLTNDSDYVSDSNYVHTDNNYTTSEKNKLSSVETNAEANVQSDWNEANSNSDAYIKNKPSIYTQTEINDLITDFITNTVDNLVNYYKKSETYTQTEVNALIAQASMGLFVVAPTLPTASADTINKIYLTPSPNPEETNIKDEYITVLENNVYKWEIIGSTKIDLSGYVKSITVNGNTYYVDPTSTNITLADYYTKDEIDILLQDILNRLMTLETVVSNILEKISDDDGWATYQQEQDSIDEIFGTVYLITESGIRLQTENNEDIVLA